MNKKQHEAEIKVLKDKLESYDRVICELVEYMPSGQVDTKELIIRALQTIGLSDVDIKEYMHGNIIL